MKAGWRINEGWIETLWRLGGGKMEAGRRRDGGQMEAGWRAGLQAGVQDKQLRG